MRGYLTVYLSLSLALILSLVLTMVEGARLSTVRMEAECAGDIAMNSVLAEFHRELLEQYDLLFVDMSYGTGTCRIENSAGHLRTYMQKNFTGQEDSLFPVRDWLSLTVDKAAIKEYSLASDDGGNVMKAQALVYMKGTSAEGAAAGILEQIGEVQSLGLDTRNIAEERNSIQGQIDEVELPTKEDENGEQKEISLDNPADKVNEARSSLLLSLLLGEESAGISGAAADTDQYISHRERMKGSGPPPGYRQPDGAVNQLLFDAYLFDKCGWYGNEMKKSLLKYQIEYIIAGNGSDMKNLEKIAERLLAWREVANVIYILSDSAKCAEAEALALTLTAVLQVPALAEPVKYSILFAWAFLESMYDVRSLLKGGKVPIMKTSADWKTGIGQVAGFSGNAPEGETGGQGLDYKDYLRIMLYLEQGEAKNMRAMDIMEMDIRQTPGNSRFRMDGCFDSFLSELSVESGFGYRFEIQKRYSYN